MDSVGILHLTGLLGAFGGHIDSAVRPGVGAEVVDVSFYESVKKIINCEGDFSVAKLKTLTRCLH